ncbi:MAG: hypothetical protein AAGG01_13630 [Planctomycetota bacterium]
MDHAGAGIGGLDSTGGPIGSQGDRTMRRDTQISETVGTLPRDFVAVGAPAWQEEETFAESLASWMERAPWLLISGALHFVLFLIIAAVPWSTFDPVEEQLIAASLEETLEERIEIEEEPITEELPPEDSVDEPVIESFNNYVSDDQDTADEEWVFDQPSVSENPFQGDATNGDLGIGGDRSGSGLGPGGRRLRRRAAPRKTALSVALGLAWLADHQDEDGRWDADDFMKHDPLQDPTTGAGDPNHDVGLTALALLAFLGDGQSMTQGTYQDTVRRGTRFLVSQQDRDTGFIGQAVGQSYVYDHAIATLALAELVRMDQSILLRSRAQAAVNALSRQRQPYGVWGYHPPPSGNSDTSVTGWALFAFKAAQDCGLRIDEEALVATRLWLDEMTDEGTGRVGYFERGSRSSRVPGTNDSFAPERGEALTAVGLLCRFFLGDTPQNNTTMRAHADLIAKRPPRWNPEAGDCDMYYWYYGSYAMFQMGGTYWSQWNRAMESAVLESQRRDGASRGSWDPVGPWGAQGGRVYATATMVLCLEVYYRYARLTGAR